MRIAVLTAMAEEIDHYLQTCRVTNERSRVGVTFYEARYGGHDLVAVKAGVGKVHAAMCTQILIDDYSPDAVICTGAAGAMHEELDIGDIVIAEDCVQHDVRVEFLGLPPGQIPFSDLRFFRSDPELVERALNVDVPNHGMHRGRVCTGDTFIQDESRRNALREELDGDCVEMEGAAVGQVCTLNEVPFLLVRGISDRSDGSSDLDFQAFLETAAQASAEIVMKLVAELEQKSGW